LSLALVASPFDDDGSDAPTIETPVRDRLLGNRYRILELLGRGGMGEVYRAFDLKLRVDVALKTVRPERAASGHAQDLIRREVRAAREVVSPNVCRIFDLVDQDDHELLSMEYIDGTTLGDTLRERGPLGLQEAREIAAQFLAGLEAIHRAGLVHGDFKPENVMLTRAGRVVVMDFGVAKPASAGPTRQIAGTPAYMAPEQARGEDVDARADVFSAGVVLTEMVSLGGGRSIEARQALWRAVRETPPNIPEGPWAAVLTHAVAQDRNARPASARALARALEEVTWRLPGFEERRPYPGLAAFTEQDAEYFFGREAEVEAVWKKLKRPRLVGLIGPSGAGKTSFLRAGVLPTLPDTWKSVLSTPGTRPFQALAQVLVPHCVNDTEALQALVHFEDIDTAVTVVSRWRRRHQDVIVIVDQFEELFTQNPPATQEAFARLLGRLVLEADAHVIVSMRDDFLVHCHGHEALSPILSDLTLLGPIGASGLRRALVQPALSCGYRFEDESIVDEMIQEVAEERGALPLVAFAASRLWEKRDRQQGLLTRKACDEIGGVGGALAQHAEATLDRIGTERLPLVRELFRNLVTAQGTRAVRERNELLSVFDREARAGARQEAEAVLNQLVDARLLVSYDRVSDDGAESRQQIEIIHESLLAAWPRLVRWQTQDADGAQVRDQLRHAAQVWQERGRPEDLLWSGTAYRDFAVWRERYPGGLSQTEEAFADASERRAGRTRRVRQIATAAIVAAIATVAVAMFVLWRHSEASRAQAETEARRAEAGKLLVMGEREIQRYPTAALAYTIKSLELSDTEAGRLLALRVLQRAPLARIARTPDAGQLEVSAQEIDFSPTGEWAAWGGRLKAQVLHRDGTRRLLLGDYDRGTGPVGTAVMQVRFGPAGDVLVSDRSGDIRVWSVPEGRAIGRARLDPGRSELQMGDAGFVTLTQSGNERIVRAWPLPLGQPRVLGSIGPWPNFFATGRDVGYAKDGVVYLRSFNDWAAAPRPVAEATAAGWGFAVCPDGAHIVTSGEDGQIRVWSTTRPGRPERTITSSEPILGVSCDSAGRRVVAHTFQQGYPGWKLFDLTAPGDTEPIVMQKGDTSSGGNVAFDPSGRWFATTHGVDVAFWFIGMPRPRVFRTIGGQAAIGFAPDGHSVLALSGDRSVRSIPLTTGTTPRVVTPPGIDSPLLLNMSIDPLGRTVARSGADGRLSVVTLESGSVQALAGFSAGLVGRPGFSPDGRLLAAGLLGGPRGEKRIRVWDLDAGTVRVFGPFPGAGEHIVGGIPRVQFVGQDRLLASILGTGLVSIDLGTGAVRTLVSHRISEFALGPDGTVGAAMTTLASSVRREPSPLLRVNVPDGTVHALPSHGSSVTAIAIDPTGTLVASGSSDGTIRVGRLSGEEPHILIGPEGQISSLAFSPDGRWLVSCGEAFAIYVWPVPDVSRPPLQRRPHDELLDALRSHTNLQAVPDPSSATGYGLSIGPFQGWATPPIW
jgi:WD40 repeat protein